MVLPTEMFGAGNLNRIAGGQNGPDCIRADVIFFPIGAWQKVQFLGTLQAVVVAKKLQDIAVRISEHHDEAGALKEFV